MKLIPIKDSVKYVNEKDSLEALPKCRGVVCFKVEFWILNTNLIIVLDEVLWYNS